MNNKEWFKKAGFGMMIHWGLYALPAGEWKGRRMPQDIIGEWCQQYYRIPGREYERLADAFNPVLFSADEWAELAVAAGMKYMVFTAKHHDGFAMFKSDVSDYNVVDRTPFGRDVVNELAEACRRHGLKFGLYYSEDLDWHEPDGGGYTMGHTWCGDKADFTNSWDFPNAGKDFSRCFEKKIKPQVKELLTRYGELCLLWFDTPVTIKPEQTDELYALVKRYQPDCLVNSRIGNGWGDYTSAEDNEIPDDDKGEALFETPATMNDTWGFKYSDDNWKSAERLLQIKEHLNSRGINYLLNVGPDYLGRIPAPAEAILREMGKK